MIYIPGYSDKGNNSYNKNSNNKTYNNNYNKSYNYNKSIFMKNYLDNFDSNDLINSLSLERFESVSSSFEKLKSASSIRKIYDTYYDIIYGAGDENQKNIKIQIWFAKVGYQETRKLLPEGFLRFLKGIYKELNDKQKFKDFLEVFVAYHKYFNPKAN
ncbi:type III-A CRISPR-associated protein Csm2 [Candidatus Vampirococcus lugosii]|uniref:CRISPR system Cms protein Csm2 n=1 Tax=Candidatus Vampirococcus lugosii TaxID=2789015 RepID=A0ABS5QKG9_9BACT|nr:type III-A CRISPR-associated protein Csm2 [Candidatus Vampirococcus lugosii]MBS8121730.1 hypothetical protein [Candidatus Vampirococcus lugosii]